MNEMTIRGAEKKANLRVCSQRVAKCRESRYNAHRGCFCQRFIIVGCANKNSILFERAILTSTNGAEMNSF